MSKQNQKDSKQKFFTVSADVGVFTEIQKAMDVIVANMGVPDLVICNAGVSYPSFLVDNPPERIEKELRLNYLGSVYSVKAALPSMMEKKQGEPFSVVDIIYRLLCNHLQRCSTCTFCWLCLLQCLKTCSQRY
jgi:NADP-dependent 3-hydroxy acid dehydrogenase YdfG